jgi:hypothetical protein
MKKETEEFIVAQAEKLECRLKEVMAKDIKTLHENVYALEKMLEAALSTSKEKVELGELGYQLPLRTGKLDSISYKEDELRLIQNKRVLKIPHEASAWSMQTNNNNYKVTYVLNTIEIISLIPKGLNDKITINQNTIEINGGE